ncbi:MAG: ATP-binding protein [Candidatus Hadarchaeales archaeon]
MFDPAAFVNRTLPWLRREIGEEKVLAAVSGGVDSMVTAVLGHRAVGERLKVVFLNTGFMREGEGERVERVLAGMGIRMERREVEEEFFLALKGKTDPEEKRKAFREAFYSCFSKIAKELGIRVILQGTIAADVVETKGGVKTQHNVLEQIGINPLERYGYRVLEPLKDLYKPQVREVARFLGLPPEVSERRPFPGPGLSVRVLGEVTRERIELVRKATRIVEEETEGYPCFQAFAVLLSDRATGVSERGERKYGNIVVVRVVISEDAMRAEPLELPWGVLHRLSSRITREVPGVCRVLYDLTPKPPATIEFE